MTTEVLAHRFYWNRGNVGDGRGYSTKLSVKLLWEPRDLWIGVYWAGDRNDVQVYVCLLPCLPIRIHRIRSYGGRFR